MSYEQVLDAFERTPSRLKVASTLLDYGFRVAKDGKIYAGEIEMTNTKIARAIGVDRKVVDMCCEVILNNKELLDVFSRLKPVADISEVARKTGRKKLGVIEVRAKSSEIGIAALATKIIAEAGICIRYMLCKDPQFSVESTMTIVTNKPLSGDIVDRLLAEKNIISVTIS